MIEAKKTILEAFQWGIECLKDSGVVNPRLDAEILLAYCIHGDRSKIYLHHDKRIDREEYERYINYIRRRMEREPVAYITGYKEFRSLSFKLTKAVLIPRPETEILVEEMVKEYTKIKENGHLLRILELGTGSGIIAVSLAKEIAHSSIIATDISLEIIKLAKDNAQSHGVNNKISFFVGRFLQTIKKNNTYFNYIVSNPPYLSEYDWEDAQPEIKEYEPPDSLLGGKDGMDFYRIIVNDVPKLLKYHGWLILEVGMGQAGKVSDMIKKSGAYSKVVLINDLSGIPRVVKAQKG